jgi:hypothetical protein
VMFYVVEWDWEFIICLLDVLKKDFGKVDTLFQGILGLQKSELDNVN